MEKRLSLITIVVEDYDDVIGFYMQKLGFDLVEDTKGVSKAP